MLFNIETAQKYSAKREFSNSSFYKSILNSYKQAVDYIVINGISVDFKPRLLTIHDQTFKQQWENKKEFERIYDNFE